MMCIHDLFTNEQPETRSALFRLPGYPVEPLKKVGNMLLRNARTLIGNIHNQMINAIMNGNGYCLTRSIFICILDQIFKYLNQAI